MPDGVRRPAHAAYTWPWRTMAFTVADAHPLTENALMLITILIIVLVIALIGGLPTWQHSRSWGYGPSGGIGLILLILLVLFLMGRL